MSLESYGSLPPVVVIVGGARSGTTLLRVLLNAHAQIASPPEAGVGHAVDDLARVWWALSPKGRWPFRADRLPGEVARQVRQAVSPALSQYCEAQGKDIYCEKSLDSVLYLDAIHSVFPDAKYLVVVRHVMDTVASGIEASPWGFASYGYAPFVQNSPDNVVAALARHWLSHTERTLAWRQAHPELCMTIRYEDLVREPTAVLRSVFEYLAVDDEALHCIRSLAELPKAEGRGDYKVMHTDRIHSESVGHGRRIPVELLRPPLLLEALNGALAQLGYGVIDTGWNAEVTVRGAPSGDTARGRLEAIMTQGELCAIDAMLGAFAIVADDAPDLRWVVDAPRGCIQRGDGIVEFALLGSSRDLVELLTGSVNAGVLLRSGRIRYIKDGDDDVAPDDPGLTVERVRAVLGAR